MRIGVLGTGEVGLTLGTGFAKHGHQVMIGTRDPKLPRVAEWVAATGSAGTAGTFAEAAAFGEIIVLATLWSGTESAISMAGTDRFKGKVVIDATNPLDFSQKPPLMAVSGNDSGGETVQRLLPEAHVVKAFNTVGSKHMVHPEFPGGRPDMFICGDQDAAKERVKALLTAFGWGVIDIGGITCARYLEAIAMVWILYYFKVGSGNHAFKMLRK